MNTNIKKFMADSFGYSSKETIKLYDISFQLTECFKMIVIHNPIQFQEMEAVLTKEIVMSYKIKTPRYPVFN